MLTGIVVGSIRALKSVRAAGEPNQIVHDSELCIFSFVSLVSSDDAVLRNRYSPTARALPKYNIPAHSGVLTLTPSVFNTFSQDTEFYLIGRETFRCRHFSLPSPSPCAFGPEASLPIPTSRKRGIDSYRDDVLKGWRGLPSCPEDVSEPFKQRISFYL
jgi:hypothetical protein